VNHNPGVSANKIIDKIQRDSPEAFDFSKKIAVNSERDDIKKEILESDFKYPLSASASRTSLHEKIPGLRFRRQAKGLRAVASDTSLISKGSSKTNFPSLNKKHVSLNAEKALGKKVSISSPRGSISMKKESSGALTERISSNFAPIHEDEPSTLLLNDREPSFTIFDPPKDKVSSSVTNRGI